MMPQRVRVNDADSFVCVHIDGFGNFWTPPRSASATGCIRNGLLVVLHGG